MTELVDRFVAVICDVTLSTMNNLINVSELLCSVETLENKPVFATTSGPASTRHSAISLMHHIPHQNSPDRQGARGAGQGSS
jgi:hypothetical protein